MSVDSYCEHVNIIRKIKKKSFYPVYIQGIKSFIQKKCSRFFFYIQNSVMEPKNDSSKIKNVFLLLVS